MCFCGEMEKFLPRSAVWVLGLRGFRRSRLSPLCSAPRMLLQAKAALSGGSWGGWDTAHGWPRSSPGGEVTTERDAKV